MNIKNIFVLPLLLLTFSAIAQTAQIAGKILNPLGNLMANVKVELIASDGSIQDGYTSESGTFSFTAPTNATYSIRVSKEEPLKGVTTLDLVFGMRHVLRATSIDSPYNFIAGDVNNSGSISVADLWQMRQMILGVQTNWERSDWVFIPTNVDFGTSIEVQAPLELLQIELTGDKLDVDFIGVKTGDISGNAYE